MSTLKEKVETFKNAVSRRFEEAPEQVLLAGAAILVGVGKFTESVAGAQSKHAYARKMNHSINRKK